MQTQFADAINEGKAGIVYEAISKWLANPLGPVGMKWVELAHRAASGAHGCAGQSQRRRWRQ